MVILVALAVLAAVFLPHLWVRHTIDRHGAHRPDLPGTGGELARHLLDRFGLAMSLWRPPSLAITTIPKPRPSGF
jgi:hypothetical protein